MPLTQLNDRSVFILPNAARPGEVVKIGCKAPGLKQVALCHDRHELLVDCSPGFANSGGRCVLFPVPCDVPGGVFSLKGTFFFVNGSEKSFSLQIPLLRKEFGHEELAVASVFSEPSQHDHMRMKKEAAELGQILAWLSPGALMELPLHRPVPGRVNSVFGLSRIMNGRIKSVHYGVDLDGVDGEPVLAAAFGRVALSARHHLGGNILVLDHGCGVFTLYMHLSTFYLTQGQVAARGEPIGEVGSSGRVTGPHLHLGLSVLGSFVDALPLLEA